MKTLLLVLFPIVLFGQGNFERIDVGSNDLSIRADQSYVHLPNCPIFRAKLVKCGANVFDLRWVDRRFKFYIGYMNTELCFIQESRKTESIIRTWAITYYKITYCK